MYVDSPMAAKMTHLYEEGAGEPRITSPLSWWLVAIHSSRPLKYTVATEESKRLNDLDCCAIVLAGAGMMTGGRILHHLKNQLYKPEASLVVVGYQSQGRWGGGRRRSQAGSHPRPGDRRSGERAHDRRAVCTCRSGRSSPLAGRHGQGARLSRPWRAAGHAGLRPTPGRSRAPGNGRGAGANTT